MDRARLSLDAGNPILAVFLELEIADAGEVEAHLREPEVAHFEFFELCLHFVGEEREGNAVFPGVDYDFANEGLGGALDGLTRRLLFAASSSSACARALASPLLCGCV